MTRKTVKKQARAAGKLADLSSAASTVVGLRLDQIARGGLTPSRSTRAEMRRMGQEKVVAAGESWLALAFAGAQLNSQLSMLALGAVSRRRALQPLELAVRASKMTFDAMLDGFNLGIEPYRKRARSNAKLLTRK